MSVNRKIERSTGTDTRPCFIARLASGSFYETIALLTFCAVIMEGMLVWVGRIVKTQGIKGQVRLYVSGERGNCTLSEGTIVYLKDPKGTRERQVTVKSSRARHPFTILGFQEIQRIEEAQKWVGCAAFIAKESLTPLPPDEFYAYQLIGLQVKTDQGVPLGVLEEIIPTGSNDVFVVRKGRKEILLPATDEVVLRVDVGKKEMTVRLLEGLLAEDDI